MKVFIDNKVSEKLSKQIEFDKDRNHLDRMMNFEDQIIKSIQSVIDDFESTFAGYKSYQSKENVELVTMALISFSKFETIFQSLSKTVKELQSEEQNLRSLRTSIQDSYEALKEEFSKIKRNINLPNIDADTYVRLSKDLDLQNAQLNEIRKLSDKKKANQEILSESFTILRSLWLKSSRLLKSK